MTDLRPLKEGKAVELESQDGRVTISPDDSPRLIVTRTPPLCDFPFQIECFDRLEAPLDKVEFLPGALLLHLSRSDVEIRLRDVESLVLHYDPKDRRPVFGGGVLLMGPARLPGYLLQWLPLESLALDGGIAGAVHIGAGLWTGARIRLVKLGPFYPFLGAFLSYTAMAPLTDDPEAEIVRDLSAGGRAGLDWAISRHFLLTGEVDYFGLRSNPEDGGPRFFSGGLSISYLF